MATTPPARTAAPPTRTIEKKPSSTASKGPLFSVALIAGWLVPGAGHLVARRWIRGGVLFASIGLMFLLGLWMQGKLYVPMAGDPLTMLGFLGDLGTGLLYIGARVFGAGQSAVQVVTADYGTKFIVVAGLLNLIAAVDAHNLHIGRKQ